MTRLADLNLRELEELRALVEDEISRAAPFPPEVAESARRGMSPDCHVKWSRLNAGPGSPWLTAACACPLGSDHHA